MALDKYLPQNHSSITNASAQKNNYDSTIENYANNLGKGNDIRYLRVMRHLVNELPSKTNTPFTREPVDDITGIEEPIKESLNEILEENGTGYRAQIITHERSPLEGYKGDKGGNYISFIPNNRENDRVYRSEVNRLRKGFY